MGLKISASEEATGLEARVGVELDSDQFVGPGVDYMPLGLGLCQATVARFEMTEKEGLLEVRV